MSIEIITRRKRVETENHYYIEPATARCHCGSIIQLDDPMDNECSDCGRNYNMAGQEVIPMRDCWDHEDY